MTLRFGFLSGNVNPLAAILFRDDVVLCQVSQVSPPDTRKSLKDEKVSRMAKPVCGQFSIQQLFKLLARQVAVVH